MKLFKIYLTPARVDGEVELLEPALDLLNKYGALIDPSVVFDMLPMDTRIGCIYTAIEKYEREATKRAVGVKIKSALLSSSKFQVKRAHILSE